MDITVLHSEPEDYRALHCIFSGPRAIAGTLQMPFPRAEMWRKRLTEPPEGLYSLVACREGEVLGSPSARRPPLPAGACVTSAASGWPYAMTGRGVGTELMEAALDLADNWLNLTRIELHVYVDNAPAMAFQSAKTPPVRFRALIDGVGAERLELVRH